MKIGVIGLSFTLRPMHEPNPCNVILAQEFDRIVKLEQAEGHQVLGSAQWELVTSVSQRTIRENLVWIVTDHRDGKSYVDTDEVIFQSKEAFDARGGVDEVVIVANPFIHLYGARSLARKYGFKVRKHQIRRVGFDKESVQWQTHGPVQAIVYTIGRVLLQVLCGHRFGQK